MKDNDFNRYFTGNMTDTEKRAFLVEVTANPALRQKYIRIKNMMGLVAYTSDLDNKKGKGASDMSGIRMKTYKMKRYFHDALGYAAVALIAVGITLFLTLQVVSTHEETQLTEIEVPVGQKAHVLLSDGTSVWLNSKSKFSFPAVFNGDKRQVYLDGEAYLEVAKDEDKPFILHTSRGDVRVLGTKFNVFNYSDKPLFETTLLQGAVEVDCGAKGGKLYLSPNEQVVLNDGKMLKRTVKEDEFLLWNEGLLYFDNQFLSYIILRLESYYDVKFVVQNRNCLKGRFTAKFRVGDDIKVILDALINTGRFSYKLSVDNKIVYIQ